MLTGGSACRLDVWLLSHAVRCLVNNYVYFCYSFGLPSLERLPLRCFVLRFRFAVKCIVVGFADLPYGAISLAFQS